MKKKISLVLLALLIILSSSSFSQIKEIQTIEEYSQQFLNPDFKLDEDKFDNTNYKEEEEEPVISNDKKDKTENIDLIEEKEKVNEISQEEYNRGIAKKIDLSEVNNKENVAKKIEKSEIKKPKKVNVDKINWDIDTDYRAAILGDTDGNVYFSKNADKLYPLASVTKIMTLLVTFDQINAGKISLKDKVVIGAQAAAQGGSKIALKKGQVFTLEDLIKASAIYSANNATYAIANYISKGDMKKFIAMMNAKVKKLGLEKDLKYYTPAGLPTRMTKLPMDSGTPRAIYKLSIEALKYKKYIQIAGIKETRIHDGKIKIRNRNKLLGKEGIYGIKTGFHNEARYNISVATKKGNKTLIVVVFGGKTYTERDKTVLEILDVYNQNY